MTKGPLAGRIEEFDEEQAKAIEAEGMGQDINGLSDRNLMPAAVTQDAYPIKKRRKAGKKRTYKRRDMQAESAEEKSAKAEEE
jgi:hypothetical protein